MSDEYTKKNRHLVCFYLYMEWSMSNNQTYGFELITFEQMKTIMEHEFVTLIDLRDYEEYAKHHLSGAKNVSVEQITNWVSYLPSNRTIILYCAHGNRSIQAAKKISNHKGKVYTLAGGIDGN